MGINKEMNAETRTKQKIAVLLVGGKSTRMGSDKFLLVINRKPQWRFMVDELSKYFDAVHIACRPDQAQHFPLHNLILDPTESIGPMGAIVSAFELLQDSNALFFVSCDLPHFKVEIAEKLLVQNELNIDVCAAKSEHKDFAEPLVAIWNRSALLELKKHIAHGDYALYRCMSELRVKTVSFSDELLKNVNRQEDL